MLNKNYEERAKKIVAYCAVQYKILEIYDPSISIDSALKDLSEPSIKAIRKRREKNIRALEKLAQTTDEKILFFKRTNLELAQSEKTKEIMKTLEDIKKEYEKLKG